MRLTLRLAAMARQHTADQYCATQTEDLVRDPTPANNPARYTLAV